MEKCNPLNELMMPTMDHLKGVTDANTIIGAPIHADGVTLIPVSKLSVGVGGGGTAFSTKNQSAGNNFGGGSAASAKLEPVAFLIIQNGGVKLMPVNANPSGLIKVVDTVPEVVDKVTDFIDKQQEKKAKKAAAAASAVDFAD